jgi:hypothetical protein
LKFRAPSTIIKRRYHTPPFEVRAMPFRTNCPKCGKEMLLLKSMYGKPKRCQHCDMLFRVGGGPLPTESELAAFEAQQAAAPAPKPKPAVVRSGAGSEPIADVIPVDDAPPRYGEAIADVIPVDDRPARSALAPLPVARRRTPVWLVLASIGLVLAGLGVAGFFVWKAVSERDSTSRSAESKKKDDKDDDEPRDRGKPLTRADLQRLRIFMPQAEALSILGPPTQIDDSMKPKRAINEPPVPERNYLRKFFWRRAGGESVEVHFLGDKVHFYKGKVDGLEMDNGRVVRDDNARLTVAKYRQLVPGMSEKAATDVLGGWQSRSNFNQFNPITKQQEPRVNLTYTEGASNIQLRFANDKLLGATAVINGLPQPPIGK